MNSTIPGISEGEKKHEIRKTESETNPGPEARKKKRPGHFSEPGPFAVPGPVSDFAFCISCFFS